MGTVHVRSRPRPSPRPGPSGVVQAPRPASVRRRLSQRFVHSSRHSTPCHSRPISRRASRTRFSSSSVIRCPRSRSRLISISFRPPSRPAACSAFGRPRTTTRGLDRWHAVDDGAGAPGGGDRLRAAACARIPVNARCTPFERAQRARLQRAPAACAARRSARRRSRSACAARRCSDRRSPSGDRCRRARARPACGSRARASPLTSIAEQLPDLVDVVARLPLRRGAGEDVARRRQRVHRPRGDAAPVALLADDAEVAELEAAVVADEDVHRRQVAVQQLAAMQLAEHLQDAGDLAPRRGLRPRPLPCRSRNALRSP